MSCKSVSWLLAFFYKRLYHELGWAYDAVSWLVSLGRWRAWTRVSLRYIRGRRVLEVGCGTGHLLLALADWLSRASAEWRLVGCDLSPAMLRQARRHIRRSGQELALCRASSQAMPFAAASFDTVIATFPSSYILDRRTWDEFGRLLAPDGRVVVVYGAHIGRRSPVRRLLQGLLSLGQVRGRAFYPDLAGLRVEHHVVEEGPDRVGLLIVERTVEHTNSDTGSIDASDA